MGTFKKPETKTSLNPLIKTNQNFSNKNNFTGDYIVNARKKVPIKAEHILDDDTVSSVTYTYPFLLFNYSDIESMKTDYINNKSVLYNQFVATIDAIATAPELPTNSESYFRSIGQILAALGFASVILEGSYIEKAKTFFNTIISWSKWGQDDFRDLGMSQMIAGACICFDMLYNNLSTEERTNALSKIYTHAVELEEAATSNELGEWLNWWASSYVQNHALVAFSALSLAALILKKENYSGYTDIYNTAVNKMNRWKTVSDGIGDGTWCEGISYSFTGTLIALPAWESFRRNESVNIIPETWLNNHVKFKIYNHLTGSKQWLSSDGDLFWNNISGRHMSIVYYASKIFLNSEYKWLADSVWQSSFSNNQNNSSYYQFMELLFNNSNINSIHPSQSYENYLFLNDWEGVIWRNGFDNDWSISTRGGGFGGKYVQQTYAAYKGNTYPWEETTPVAQINYDHQHNDMGTFWIRKGNYDFIKEIAGYNSPYVSASYHNILDIDDIDHNRNNEYESPSITASAGYIDDYANNKKFGFINFNQTKRYKTSQSILTASRYYIYPRDSSYGMLSIIDHVSSSDTSVRNYKTRIHLGYQPSSLQTNWYTCSNGIDDKLTINFCQTSGSNNIYTGGLSTGEGGDNVYFITCSKNINYEYTNFITNIGMPSNASLITTTFSQSVINESNEFIMFEIYYSELNRNYNFINFNRSQSFIETDKFKTDAQTVSWKRITNDSTIRWLFIHSGSQFNFKYLGDTIKLIWNDNDIITNTYVEFLQKNNFPTAWKTAITASIYNSSSQLPNQLYISSSATFVKLNDENFYNFTIPSTNTILINP